jgi:hypothetical protein
LWCPYFLCLDAKKVTKKNQGQPETLRAFVQLTPHISLRKYFSFGTLSYQAPNVEVTVALQLNQGE